MGRTARRDNSSEGNSRMIVDCDRHAAVRQYTELFPYMTLDWRKHFEREEWISSVVLGSNHIRVTEQFAQEEPPPYVPPDEGLTLVVPHQGLTVNGWADRVAAKTFLEAINSFGEDHWARPRRAGSPYS
jgi:hypothetical protein